MAKERLDKLLASQGMGSRKEVAHLIRTGQVIVDGNLEKHPESKWDPETASIVINGRSLLFQRFCYLMMNKPKGVISASNDPRCRTVIDLVPEKWRRKGLFPAGRLDKDTEGLLIITNDGDFAHRMLSPKKQVFKLYEAEVSGKIGEDQIQKFQEGIILEDGTKCLPAQLQVVRCDETSTVHVWICEGKFHQIKRMFLAVNSEVLRLKRLQIGQLALDQALEPGICREISEKERKLVFLQAFSTK